MAPRIIFLCAILFLSLIDTGSCACTLDNIAIGTRRTGRSISSQGEWEVTVINECDGCSQSNLIVSCTGFQTVVPVPTRLLKPIGNDKCIVNHGNAIPSRGSIKFSYAWNSPFTLWPRSSTVRCSN